MAIMHRVIDLQTDQDIGIYNLSPQIQALVAASSIQNGQVLICSRHTTTALAINEYEERLLTDIKVFCKNLHLQTNGISIMIYISGMCQKMNPKMPTLI